MHLETCPCCGDGLRTVARVCRGCGVEFRAPAGTGLDGESPFAALDAEAHGLLLRFALLSGNLKALGEELGVSYPTVRARLDRAIAALAAAAAPPAPVSETEPAGPADGVLDDLEAGAIDAEQALARLRRIAT